MLDEARLNPLIVAAVGLALLTVTLPATATHNSAGAGVVVLQPDEVDSGGTLLPDVPSNEDSPGGGSPNYDGADDHPYVQTFHDNLDQTAASAREHPPDQIGDRYSNCNGPDDANTYDPGADPADCYIGFIDTQWEYQLITTTGGPYQANTFKHRDDLYPVNPDDKYCSGEENPEEHPGPGVDDGGPIDQTIARANRSTQGECSGEDHRQYTPPHNLAVDTDLMEAPFQGDQNGPGASDALGTEEGSGTLSFPLLTSYYIFLFGQPHPSNVEDSGYEAGSGVFGPNPAAGGSPLVDLTNACEGRTQACTLLEPEDIVAYDPFLQDREDFSGNARVCTFEPQFVTVNPGDDIESGDCGVFGDRVGQYVHTHQGGGLGLDGAPPTMVNTPPGWYDNLFFLHNEPLTSTTGPLALCEAYSSNPESFCGDHLDDEQEISDGTFLYTAVNPKVPKADSPVWCARPNFVGTASEIGTTGLSDHGLYDYTADAIDSDIYTNVLLGPLREVSDVTHGPARTVLGPVQSIAEDVQDAAGGTDDLDNIRDNDNVPAPVREGFDRALFVEGDEAEPDLVEEHFDAEVSDGLRCNGNGVIEFQEDPDTPSAGVTFDVDIEEASGGFNTCDRQATGQLGICTGVGGATLKDPTLFESGLPARESDTAEGHWSPNALTIEGTIRGVIDTNLNGEFDACQVTTGQPNPDNDQCPWTALWDVYNGACADGDGTACSQLAKDDNYNIDASGDDQTGPFGVGLYFVARITGPVLVVDEGLTQPDQIQSRSELVGDQDPIAQNCIVGISTGFKEHLADHVGTTSGQDDSWDVTEDLASSELCGGTPGEVYVIDDAFDDQSVASGSFSAAVDLVKLTPTPDAVRDTTGGLGSGDEICATGIWTVNDNQIAGDTTDAQSMTGVTDYGDCDTLATGIQ